MLSIIITVTTTKPGSGGMQRRRSPSSFPRFLCAASLPLSFPGHPVECAGVSGTTHCRRYLFWFKGAGRAIPQRECLSEALLQPAGRNRLVRGGCFNRIWKVADAYRKGELTEEQALSGKVLKAILHYGGIEAGRPMTVPVSMHLALPYLRQRSILISAI